MDKRMIGCKVCFGAYESVVREILVNDRCRIDFPKEEGRWVMLPQYTQYMFCFYIEEKGKESCLCAKGQVLSRYRIHNREVVEIELIEGLYRKDPIQLRGISDVSLEKLQKTVENTRINVEK